MDHPATLKQYAEWFRYYFPQQATEEDNADKAAEQEAGDGSKPRNGIRARWEKYKKEFMASQVRTLLPLPSIAVQMPFPTMTLDVDLTEFSYLYCSCKRCLTITGSLLGLRINMIQQRSFQRSVNGLEKMGGKAV